MTLPVHAKAWLQQRQAGDAAVAALEARELRELDDATALRFSEALLAAAPRDLMTVGRTQTSGFVEQQRLFMRGR